jgi:hypothetical protein
MGDAVEKQFELRHDGLDLLAWNIANEVINGFRVENFEGRTGLSREEFNGVALRLRSVPETKTAMLTMQEARAFYQALAITLEELGEEEFQTRTGHSFDEGSLLLSSLAGFLK